MGGVGLLIFTSGSAQGMLRCVLALPGLFALLAHWGCKQVFERLWTLLSVLLMGLEVLLFSFNFWVALEGAHGESRTVSGWL